MTWVLWALAVAVLGGCVVVAVGRGGEMREVYDDRPDVLVPGERPLGADDLRAVRFTTAFRGYRMAEVDALLARLAAELDTAELDTAAELDAAAPPGVPQPDDASPVAVEDHAPDVTGFARRDEDDRAG